MIYDELLHFTANPDLTIAQLKHGSDVKSEPADYLLREQWIQTHNIQGMIADKPGYHHKLQKVFQAPHLLYFQGDQRILDRPIVAIVGPRLSTPYGSKVIERVFEELQDYEVVTISGMAPGIDQLCHRLSLKYHIPTIAVLGGGIQRYQDHREHQLMHDIVAQGGLILSEFKLNQQSTKYTFPQRNRIVAGLGDIVIVPEASAKSGSLITVEYAHRMGKIVYGAPQALGIPQSDGLLKALAENKIKLLYNIPQIIKTHFSPKTGGISPKVALETILSPQEQVIVSFLQQESQCHIDQLLHTTHLPYQEILSTITSLELKNIVTQINPGLYKLG